MTTRSKSSRDVLSRAWVSLFVVASLAIAAHGVAEPADVLSRLRDSVAAEPRYRATVIVGTSTEFIQPAESVAEMLAIPGVSEHVTNEGKKYVMTFRRRVVSDGSGSVRRETENLLLSGQPQFKLFAVSVWSPDAQFDSTAPQVPMIDLRQVAETDPATIFSQINKGITPWRYQAGPEAYELVVRLAADMLSAATDRVSHVVDGVVRVSSQSAGIECDILHPPGILQRVAYSRAPTIRQEIVFHGVVGDPIFPSRHPKVWVEKTFRRSTGGEWQQDGEGIRVYEDVEPLQHLDRNQFSWTSVAARARTSTGEVIDHSGAVDLEATRIAALPARHSQVVSAPGLVGSAGTGSVDRWKRLFLWTAAGGGVVALLGWIWWRRLGRQ